MPEMPEMPVGRSGNWEGNTERPNGEGGGPSIQFVVSGDS